MGAAKHRRRGSQLGGVGLEYCHAPHATDTTRQALSCASVPHHTPPEVVQSQGCEKPTQMYRSSRQNWRTAGWAEGLTQVYRSSREKWRIAGWAEGSISHERSSPLPKPPHANAARTAAASARGWCKWSGFGGVEAPKPPRNMRDGQKVPPGKEDFQGMKTSPCQARVSNPTHSVGSARNHTQTHPIPCLLTYKSDGTLRRALVQGSGWIFAVERRLLMWYLRWCHRNSMRPLPTAWLMCLFIGLVKITRGWVIYTEGL